MRMRAPSTGKRDPASTITFDSSKSRRPLAKAALLPSRPTARTPVRYAHTCPCCFSAPKAAKLSHSRSTESTPSHSPSSGRRHHGHAAFVSSPLFLSQAHHILAPPEREMVLPLGSGTVIRRTSGLTLLNALGRRPRSTCPPSTPFSLAPSMSQHQAAPSTPLPSTRPQSVPNASLMRPHVVNLQMAQYATALTVTAATAYSSPRNRTSIYHVHTSVPLCAFLRCTSTCAGGICTLSYRLSARHWQIRAVLLWGASVRASAHCAPPPPTNPSHLSPSMKARCAYSCPGPHSSTGRGVGTCLRCSSESWVQRWIRTFIFDILKMCLQWAPTQARTWASACCGHSTHDVQQVQADGSLGVVWCPPSCAPYRSTWPSFGTFASSKRHKRAQHEVLEVDEAVVSVYLGSTVVVSRACVIRTWLGPNGPQLMLFSIYFNKCARACTVRSLEVCRYSTLSPGST
jgi:hypothetical protein